MVKNIFVSLRERFKEKAGIVGQLRRFLKLSGIGRISIAFSKYFSHPSVKYGWEYWSPLLSQHVYLIYTKYAVRSVPTYLNVKLCAPLMLRSQSKRKNSSNAGTNKWINQKSVRDQLRWICVPVHNNYETTIQGKTRKEDLEKK